MHWVETGGAPVGLFADSNGPHLDGVSTLSLATRSLFAIRSTNSWPGFL